MTIRKLLCSALILFACNPEGEVPELRPLGELTARLTDEERRARATDIRNAAAERGLVNGLILAGIAQAETGLAHCWSEAMWACQGPASSSCEGGPVIAGAGDGPCSLMQGGLGMFQFDAGTYAETLVREGDRVLTVEGNTQAAVDFVIAMVMRSTYATGIDTAEQALAWMNEVRVDGTYHNEWIQTVTHYYNGCTPSGCSVYDQRYAHYADALRHMLDELGADFWYEGVVPNPSCSAVPAGGRVIEETDACFQRFGDERYWRTEAAGSAEGLIWTHTIEDATPSNHAAWRLRMAASGRYLVEAFTAAAFAQSRQARYRIAHADGDAEIVLDQTAADDFQPLGTFRFEGDNDYLVALGDNTGEPLAGDIQLVFDALRVTPEQTGGAGGEAGAGGEGGAGGQSGGAGTGGGQPPGGAGGTTGGSPGGTAGTGGNGIGGENPADDSAQVTSSCRAAPGARPDRAPLLLCLVVLLALALRRSEGRAEEP